MCLPPPYDRLISGFPGIPEKTQEYCNKMEEKIYLRNVSTFFARFSWFFHIFKI